MAGHSDKEVHQELVHSQREMFEVLKEVSGRLSAYQAAVHSLIETHPDRKALANDFLERMDRVAEVQKQGVNISPAWQLIVSAMTSSTANPDDRN